MQDRLGESQRFSGNMKVDEDTEKALESPRLVATFLKNADEGGTACKQISRIASASYSRQRRLIHCAINFALFRTLRSEHSQVSMTPLKRHPLWRQKIINGDSNPGENFEFANILDAARAELF